MTLTIRRRRIIVQHIIIAALVIAAGISFVVPLLPVQFAGNRMKAYIANALVVGIVLFLLKAMRISRG
jgi:hypothetical protein